MAAKRAKSEEKQQQGEKRVAETENEKQSKIEILIRFDDF